jgi:uncharacterized protein (DUF3084 family)
VGANVDSIEGGLSSFREHLDETLGAVANQVGELMGKADAQKSAADANSLLLAKLEDEYRRQLHSREAEIVRVEQERDSRLREGAEDAAARQEEHAEEIRKKDEAVARLGNDVALRDARIDDLEEAIGKLESDIESLNDRRRESVFKRNSAIALCITRIRAMQSTVVDMETAPWFRLGKVLRVG